MWPGCILPRRKCGRRRTRRKMTVGLSVGLHHAVILPRIGRMLISSKALETCTPDPNLICFRELRLS